MVPLRLSLTALRRAPDALLSSLIQGSSSRTAAPTVAAALCCARAGVQGNWEHLPSRLIATEVALRAWLVAALLVHEAGHALAAACASLLLWACGCVPAGAACTSARAAVIPSNLLGRVSARSWALLLLPSVCGAEGLKHAPCVAWKEPPSSCNAVAVARFLIRLAGPAFSLVFALAVRSAGDAAVSASLLVLAAGVVSDLFDGAADLSRLGLFRCGNFGCLVNLKDRFAKEHADYAPLILERMCGITQVRGGQAAGIASMLCTTPDVDGLDFGACDPEAPEQVVSGGVAPPPLLCSTRRRLVNSKRGNMSAALRSLYCRAAGGSYARRATCAAFIGHTRFATASLPAVSETHPHEWTPFQPRARAWVFQGGSFVVSQRPRGIHLTHNGDLDAVRLFRHEVPVTQLGLWLERVLHCPNSTRGDSPKGAAMMELLTCQGCWKAAVRYAYQEAVAQALTEASGGVALSKTAPNTAPTEAWQCSWAAVLDAVFEQKQTLLARPYGGSDTRFAVGSVMVFVEAVLEHLAALPPLQQCGLGIAPTQVKAEAAHHAAAEAAHVRLMAPLTLRKFLKRAAEAFALHDVYHSLRLLLARAQGSFGITVLSALEPDTVAIAAWGQQMSLALHEGGSLALFGSEAAALKVPIRQQGASPAGWEFMTHRLDLDETYGEVCRLSLRPRPVVPLGSATDVHVLAEEEPVPNGSRKLSRSQSLHRMAISYDDPSDPAAMMWHGLRLSSFRVRLGRQLLPRELRQRLVPLRRNPLVQPLPLLSGAAANDPVGADLEALPAVLQRIRAEWANADSLNRLSAASFARILLEKCALNAANESRDYDLLVVGVETSLWLAEQWVADVTRAMPRVSALALSANKVTAMMGCDIDAAAHGFPLSRAALAPRLRNALVLVVSQSGQTFPGLHATRLLRHAVGNRVFVLTGEFDTKMGCVGQDMARTQPFCARIFSNYSGWRPAEPTTVAAAAAHATLTELLLFMLHAYTVELSEQQRHTLLGMTLPRDDVRCLAELRDGSTDESVPAICLRADGRSVVGLSLRQTARRMLVDWTAGKLPGVHERLVEAGQTWATRVNECWHATVFSAAYVAGTILLQFAPMNVVSQVVGCGQPFWHICPIDYRCCIIGFALRLVDVAIYIWIGWAFLLLSRRLRGDANVFARRGKRVLVIADVPWVHQSLEVFVSKLFALSYGDNGLDVHGANPADSLVHRFTHRVQRGVLIALGRPDGRISAHQRAEGACLLAAMQAAAIQNLGTGPEIVSLGHNSARGNPGAISDHVVLPTNRRPFVCEFLAKAKHGEAAEVTLAALGRGGAASRAMLYDVHVLCDRCAVTTAVKKCMQCRSSYCSSCNLIVHLRGDIAKREHTPLPLKAEVLMRAAAQRARTRLLQRAGVTEETDEAEEADPSAAAVGDWSRLGAGAGNAFPAFGALSGALRLAGHGRVLAVSGAPLGVHHARRHLAGVASERARLRWRVAARVLIWQRSPWKTFLLSIKRTAAQTDGTPVTAFAALYGEVGRSSASGVLEAEAVMKDLYEGRIASLERYIAFLVLFHAMALRVSNTSWPLPQWELGRSQSILRVASTAAPVSGAEVAAQLKGEPASMAFTVYRRVVEGRITSAKTTVVVSQAVEEDSSMDAVQMSAAIAELAQAKVEQEQLQMSLTAALKAAGAGPKTVTGF